MIIRIDYLKMEIFSSNEPEINHNEVPIHNEEEYELFIGNKQLKSSQKDANKESGFESNITDHSGKRPPDGGIQVKTLILIRNHLNIVLLYIFCKKQSILYVLVHSISRHG